MNDYKINKSNNYVLVIGVNGMGLMPTNPRKARLLIKSKKAKVVRTMPFTIELLYKTGCATQKINLGIDTGSQHVGAGITSKITQSNNQNRKFKVLSKTEYEFRSTMEKRQLMETRKTYRRGRRYRKVRYRKPKFKTKTSYKYVEDPRKGSSHWKKVKHEYGTNRPEGWLPPSIQQKVNHHIQIIDRYLEALPPHVHLTIEIGRFDMQRIDNPTIHNEQYQQGRMYDNENVKAYALSKYNYRCPICGGKFGSYRKDGSTVLPEMHHIHYRSKGASDNPDDLIPVCNQCHSAKNHKEGGALDELRKSSIKRIRGKRDMSFMNIVASRLREEYPCATFTYGNITNADRKDLHLGKTHANDAVAISLHSNIIKDECVSVEDTDKTIYYKQVRKKKRSLHEATPRKGRKEPNRAAKRNSKNTKTVVSKEKKYALYDKVSYNGQVGWISGFAGLYTAYIKTFDGEYLKPVGKTYTNINLSQVEIIQRNNNWILEIK